MRVSEKRRGVRARAASPARGIARGAAAGAVAATAWSAVEPLAARALGTGYTDVRLLGRLASARRPGAAGLLIHALNGAAFGALFTWRRASGPAAGLRWASAEAAATWPGMAVLDRIHPDRRSGRWPRLLTNRRIMAQEALMHALFGVLLGLLAPRR